MKLIYEYLVEDLSKSYTDVKVTCFFLYFLFISNSLKQILTDYSAVYLREGESHFISIPDTFTERFYEATFLETNATNGFRVVFQDLYLRKDDDEVQIGKGNDPSDIQSVIATVDGYANYGPDDVYIDTNEMWFAALGGRQNSGIRVDVGVTAIDLLSEYNCINRILLFYNPCGFFQ